MKQAPPPVQRHDESGVFLIRRRKVPLRKIARSSPPLIQPVGDVGSDGVWSASVWVVSVAVSVWLVLTYVLVN